MSQIAELDRRVTRLEERMDDVHDLASRTGQEVADWRTTLNNHTNTLNAMSDQINGRFDKVDDRFDKVDKRIDKLEADLRAEMREGFTKIGIGMAQITALLTIHLDEPDKETRAGGTDE